MSICSDKRTLFPHKQMHYNTGVASIAKLSSSVAFAIIWIATKAIITSKTKAFENERVYLH